MTSRIHFSEATDHRWPTSRHLLVQNQHWKHQNSVWNLFKIHNKDTNLWSDFTHCCGAANVDFEQVNTSFENWRRPSINWIFLPRRPIQNHSKPSIGQKRQIKAKYPTWNSITLEFLRKTIMSNPVENLGYIKCRSLSIPTPIKSQFCQIQLAEDLQLIGKTWNHTVNQKRGDPFSRWLTLY